MFSSVIKHRVDLNTRRRLGRPCHGQNQDLGICTLREINCHVHCSF
jgi:hypothetical protein